MADHVYDELLSQQQELETKLKEANDMCDMWYANLSLADKIELMARYYQLREKSRFVVCDKERIHVWDNATRKGFMYGTMRVRRAAFQAR